MSVAETPNIAYKTGVVYLSRIPPHMKVHKLRHILSKFGQVRRMYVRKEPMWKYKKRLDKGGRKGRLFIDGWAEFLLKRDAKDCEENMNGKDIGIRGRWAHEIWCVKYLHGFKWVHLENALEEERQKNMEKLKEETEKTKETAKKWLKQTKTTVFSGKIGHHKSAPANDNESEDDSGPDEEEDDGDDHIFTTE